jgi:hypothetical protein
MRAGVERRRPRCDHDLVLLLVHPHPRSGRLPWAPMPALGTAIALGVIAATRGEGAAGLLAALGSFTAACRALDRALPYRDGLRDHRQ